MKAIRKILVAIKNPDARSQAGADKAIGIARTLGATVEFFHAISTPVLLDVAPLTGTSLAEIRREALTLRRARLERLVQRARQRGVEAACSVTWDYPPHEAIVRRARRIHAGLIIAEAHHGRRLRPWLMHVTDWELLRASSAPVLLLKNTRPWSRPVVLASVDPTHAHAKPSGLDDAVLEHAQDFAAQFGGRAAVMHACYPPLQALAFADPAIGAATIAAVYDSQKALATRTFERFAQRHDIPAAQRHVVDEDPVHGIPRTAKRLRAQLVVMGAVSRSGLKRVFIGNTAERVLPALTSDVLVLKPGHFRSPVATRSRGVRIMAAPAMPLGI